MKHLVAVGACYIDTILTVPHYPEEDSKLRASSLRRRRGGNCANALEVLQQLLPLRDRRGEAEEAEKVEKEEEDESIPLHLSLAAILPAPETDGSRFIHASLPPPIDTRLCIHRPDCVEAASSYVIQNAASGSRTIVNFNDLGDMSVDEFSAIADRVAGDDQETWFHFEGRNEPTLLHAAQYLRSHFPHSKISVELENPRRPDLRHVIPYADVLFFSKTWAKANGLDSAKACLEDFEGDAREGALLCCAWGEQGATALDTRRGEYFSAGPWKPENGQAVEVVDPVGAGDTFIAGILYGLLLRPEGEEQGWPLQQKLTFANELAGRKVAQEGFEGLGEQVAAWLQR